MIYIEKGQVNTFALTLTEVTTLVDPFYLFVFQEEFNTTADPILWEGVDTSSYPYRYNLFTMEEGVDIDFNKGQYTYSVYESSTPIIIDINTDLTDFNLIEEGRLVVSGVSISNIYD
jgi:hypothetical protein